MTESTQNKDQRVTNAKIFAKLETMNDRLKNVEETCGVTAAHSVRCGVKWDQYEKDQERASGRLGKLESKDNSNNRKDVALIAGVVAIVVAIINVASLLLQSGLP